MGPIGGTIAMRIKYLTAITIVAFAGIGLAVHSVEKQATPAAAQWALAEAVNPFLLRSGS
jgi:hypothetical protein